MLQTHSPARALPLHRFPEFAPLLSRFDFDEPYRQGTNTALVETEDGLLIESWSGYALIRFGRMLKAFDEPYGLGGEKAASLHQAYSDLVEG